ncbi:hypothetical protein NM208_g7349 [Fusarium decemcellulare]|uniref:Uncharacterized protein n=1 Tax=Fusarium decemcellulare TaxID=57161 RepID=A0ACC1S9Q8_9HYPO|nr:hypothetical protein NM208_g7349 [Fusarium decemcellulare]
MREVDVQIYFDYNGLPAEVTDHVFEKAFQALNFDEILQYVSFPNVTVAITGRRQILFETQKRGQGRRDMEFFFDWLYKKGVRHIINVHVDDVRESHSDESILSSLGRIKVDNLDWKKIDLDPLTICRVGNVEETAEDDSSCTSRLREVTLHWSGNNAVLRAWSEPEGLPMLLKLETIKIFAPSSDEASVFFTQLNLSKRRAEVSEATEKDDNEKGLEQNDRTTDATQNKNIDIFIFQAKGKGQRGETLSPVEQALKINESRAGHRWLDSVYKLADAVGICWRRAHSDLPSLGALNRDTERVAGDVVVALIDDGVDAYGSSISSNIIGGKTFAYGEGNDSARPYYISESGHGTVMAGMIMRACPVAKLYPIRLKTLVTTNGKQQIELQSAALAIQAALDKKATIILMAWSVKISKSNNQEKRLLDAVLQRACENKVLMFCPSPDSGIKEDDSYPSSFRPDSLFRIGAARDDGKAFGLSREASTLDFLFPGVEVVVLHDIDNSRRSSDDTRIDTATGPSIAAALGAGLAATLLYCFKTASLMQKVQEARGEDFKGKGELVLPTDVERLADHQYMMAVFHNLGTMTDDRFLRVWETLGPIIGDVESSSPSGDELPSRLIRLCHTLKEGSEVYF